MSGPFPLATLGCTISATGITSPSYADIYQSLQASFQAIYGSDSYINPDSQDGQMLAIFAQSIYDANQATIAAYNNFSPATAQGVGLSSVVKINGLQREASSFSTAVVTVTGVAGTIIPGGVIGDNQGLGTQWNLPANLLIPPAGSISTTATCTTTGAVSANASTLVVILNPTAGWQSVNNPSNASLGAPVETDAQLRIRQAASTSLPAQTPAQAIFANVDNLTGVTRLALYENDGSTVDSNGLPGHSISLVVEGGQALAVAQAIEAKKTPGCNTYGTTSELVIDPAGVPITINFFVLQYKQIYVAITVNPLTGYTSTIGMYIVAALVQFINSIAIGGTVQYNKLWNPANLNGSAAIAAVAAILGTAVTQAQLDAMSATYEITALTVGTTPSPTGVVDIVVPFNFVAQTQTSQVVLTA